MAGLLKVGQMVRLAPNGTNPGLIQIRFQYIWFEKIPNSILFHLCPNLAHFMSKSVIPTDVTSMSPADSGWWSDGQVLHLKHHVYEGRQFDPLTVGQTEHLVVVKHSVHVLYPQRVHGAVTDNPVVVCRCVLERLRQSDDELNVQWEISWKWTKNVQLMLTSEALNPWF